MTDGFKTTNVSEFKSKNQRKSVINCYIVYYNKNLNNNATLVILYLLFLYIYAKFLLLKLKSSGKLKSIKMKSKSIFFVMLLLLSIISSQGQTLRAVLTAENGPPAEANTWTKFVIPITAESFGTDQATLEGVLLNVGNFRIRTETASQGDIGAIDEVSIGETYTSNFGSSAEGWSAGGDGTMQWMPSGGVDGGFLQIVDWQTGDYHSLISPSSWAGDWTDLIGQNIEFWYQTDEPDYSAFITLETDPNQRLILNTTTSNTVALNDSILMEVELFPIPSEDVTVSFTSSETGCIVVAEPILVPAGNNLVYVYFYAANGAEEGCTSVTEAVAPGYETSRVTLETLGHAGFNMVSSKDQISLFPNPCRGKLTIITTSGIQIERVIIYDIMARQVMDVSDCNNNRLELNLSGLLPGIYYVNAWIDDRVSVQKLVIE